MKKFIKSTIARLAECDANKHASFSKWTTLIIWACSLVAEVGTFAFNKRLPEKEKRFIIRQELCAGGVSLGIMYLLADRFQKIGEGLVERGYLLPKDLKKILPKSLLESPQRHVTIVKILTADPKLTQKELNLSNAWIEKLIGFRNGAGLIASLCGTIIASNVTAPLISNYIASYFHNRKLSAQNKLTIAPDPFPAYFSYAGQFTAPLPHNRMTSPGNALGNEKFQQRRLMPLGVGRPSTASNYVTPNPFQPYPISLAR